MGPKLKNGQAATWKEASRSAKRTLERKVGSYQPKVKESLEPETPLTLTP
eukprot:c9276_g1_i1 orf=42-191(+)